MTQRTIVTKFEVQDAATYPGHVGEVWLDTETATLHLGDGATEGGVVIRSTGNLDVMDNTIATRDNSDVYIQTGDASNRYWWAEYGELKWNYNDSWGDNVARDSGGNIYVLGGTFAADAPSPSGVIVKYSPSGELLWDRVIVDSDGFPETYGGAIWIDKHDGIYVGIGLAYSNDPYNYIAKFDVDANVVWSEVCGINTTSGSHQFNINEMQGDNLGNLYCLANHNYNAGYGNVSCYALMKQPDSPSSSTVSKLFDNYGYPMYAYGMDVKANSIVVTGEMYDGNVWNVYLAKFDKDLNLMWHLTWSPGNYNSYGYAVSQDAQGFIYVTGETPFGGALVAKFDANGQLQWQRILDSGNSTYGYAISADTDGSVYVSGLTYSNPTYGDYEGFFLAKLEADTGYTVYTNAWTSDTLEHTYTWYWYNNAHRSMIVNEDSVSLSGFTYTGFTPDAQLNNTVMTVLNVPKDGSITDNRFVNFTYVSEQWTNDPLTWTVTPLALDAFVEVDGIWSAFDFTSIYLWNEGPTGEGIFDGVTYPLGSVYKFSTDNNLVIPVGGDIVDTGGNSITGKHVTWTNSNNNIWRMETQTGGMEFYYNGGYYEWFTPALILGDMNQFRGAIVEYHAYANGSTYIGKIIWSRDAIYDGTINQIHSGGGTGEPWTHTNYYDGSLSWYDGSTSGYTVMIQWTAKMFYGNEWGC